MLLGISLRGMPGSWAAASESYGLGAMAQFERLPYLKLDTMAGQQSSFDRTGGNNDGWSPDATTFLYTDANGDKVLLDLIGPGTVYCMWFTAFDEANANLKVYFNGEVTPRINMLIKDLCAGTNAPFLAPPGWEQLRLQRRVLLLLTVAVQPVDQNCHQRSG